MVSRNVHPVPFVWLTRIFITLVAIAALPDPALAILTYQLMACLEVPGRWLQEVQGEMIPRAIAFEAGPEPTFPVASPQSPSMTGVMTAGITFDLPPPSVSAPPDTLPPTSRTQAESTVSPPFHSPNPSAPYTLDDLFAGEADSLVARAVGSAEGTRTPDGQRTPAYGGHVDPGNGVWNLGTFSYQHGATSPEEADAKQLVRLQQQAAQLRQRAAKASIPWGLAEELNGIDLANQSPLAALQRGGYVDRLAEAQQLGLVGTDAILWARTRSYLDPDTQRWNAPGLGNNLPQISRDQKRRMEAIERAIAAGVGGYSPTG
ncbi:MAG: hypothetical protein VKK04_14735 [Synechococcales bacterium]|nr:hypothetical protein [Synechococcales bacterium]